MAYIEPKATVVSPAVSPPDSPNHLQTPQNSSPDSPPPTPPSPTISVVRFESTKRSPSETIEEKEVIETAVPNPGLKFQVYPQRWFQLFLFCFLSFTNASYWIFAVSIFEILKDVFNVSTFAVNTLSLNFLIVYVIGVFPASYVMTRFGLRVTLLTGATLQFISGWLRYGGGMIDNFGLLSIGQLFAACAQLFVLSLPTSIAGQWFGAHERSTAAAICVCSNQIGIAVGFVLPPAFVDHALGRRIGFRNLLLFQAIEATVCALLIYYFSRASPPSPPSLSSSVKRHSFIQSLKLMMGNFSFVLLFFAYTLMLGAMNAISTVLGSILDPHGYTPTQIGWIGFTNNVLGVFGSLLAGGILDKWGGFRNAAIVTYVGTLLSLLWFLVSLDFIESTFIAYAFIGIFQTAGIPVTLQCGVEYSYPVSEENSGAWLFGGANLGGVIMIFIMTFLDKEDGSRDTYIASDWTSFVAVLVGTGLTFFLGTKYTRQSMDKPQPQLDLVESQQPKSDDPDVQIVEIN